MPAPRLYSDLASWWPLVSAPSEYAEEAVFYAVTIDSLARRPVGSVLELGCGGGSNASLLKRRYEMTLTDLSPEMLAVSRALNPECEHAQGDMRTLRLGRRFDAVFVHDAVMYMIAEEDLAAAIETAAVHLEPGGVALFSPDATTETYRPGTSMGGHDGDGRAVRYLQWEHQPRGGTFRTTFVFALREGDEPVRVEVDEHQWGLFPRATWLRLIEAAGLEARALPWPHSSFEGKALEVFAGIKPA